MPQNQMCIPYPRMRDCHTDGDDTPSAVSECSAEFDWSELSIVGAYVHAARYARLSQSLGCVLRRIGCGSRHAGQTKRIRPRCDPSNERLVEPWIRLQRLQDEKEGHCGIGESRRDDENTDVFPATQRCRDLILCQKWTGGRNHGVIGRGPCATRCYHEGEGEGDSLQARSRSVHKIIAYSSARSASARR